MGGHQHRQLHGVRRWCAYRNIVWKSIISSFRRTLMGHTVASTDPLTAVLHSLTSIDDFGKGLGQSHSLTTATFNFDRVHNVTHNHPMLIHGEDGDMVPIKASDVTTSMAMSRAGMGTASTTSSIESLTRSVANRKWIISTANCMIFADGILTGTFCGNRSPPVFHLRE